MKITGEALIELFTQLEKCKNSNYKKELLDAIKEAEVTLDLDTDLVEWTKWFMGWRD